ncbi:MAG: hypothetical protein R3304_09905 [Longimicrobiales bacterium]|nr:hypothetical protein [Longimicrobiales bacterium]
MTLESQRLGPWHLLWIPAAATVGVGLPLVFDDLLALPVGLYHLVYFLGVGIFLTTYARRADLPLRTWSRRRLPWGLALGALGGLILMRGALAQPPSSGPSGALVWEILYRGVLYGLVDGLLLRATHRPVRQSHRLADEPGDPPRDGRPAHPAIGSLSTSPPRAPA